MDQTTARTGPLHWDGSRYFVTVVNDVPFDPPPKMSPIWGWSDPPNLHVVLQGHIVVPETIPPGILGYTWVAQVPQRNGLWDNSMTLWSHHRALSAKILEIGGVRAYVPDTENMTLLTPKSRGSVRGRGLVQSTIPLGVL